MKSNFIVLRLKSPYNMGMVCMYNETMRIGNVENDSDLRPQFSYLNKVYKSIGEDNIAKKINNIISNGNYEIRRKYCRKTTSFVVTASYEFFEQCGYIQGKDPPKIVSDFFDDAYSFILNEFGYNGGENILCACIHYDETTPHLQGMFIPVYMGREITTDSERNDLRFIRKRGKVNCYYDDIDHPIVGLTNFLVAKYKMASQNAFSNLLDKVAVELGSKYNLMRGIKGANNQTVTRAEWAYTNAIEVLERTKETYSNVVNALVDKKEESKRLEEDNKVKEERNKKLDEKAKEIMESIDNKIKKNKDILQNFAGKIPSDPKEKDKLIIALLGERLKDKE